MRDQIITPRSGGQGAFTLIEVVSVLTILGILAAVAIPRMIDTGAEQRIVLDKLKVHLRHAQLRGMNSDQPWGVKCTGNGYFMFRDGDENDKVRFMGDDQVIVDIPSQVSVSSFIISFDSWGAPYVGADPDPEAGTRVSDPGYTISVGDETVTILPETGFIQ
jgi:prepilin-type N-terminal cleavage/methylation domain-containing protein